MTFQPIRFSTNFMTLIPSLTFTELRVVFMEHLQRMWHASRESLPLQTSGYVPLFFWGGGGGGGCMCFDCWDHFPDSINLRIYQTPTCEKFLSFKRPETCQVYRIRCILWIKLIKSILPESIFEYCTSKVGYLSDISK